MLLAYEGNCFMGDSLRSLMLMATRLYYKLRGGFYRGKGLDPSMGW